MTEFVGKSESSRTEQALTGLVVTAAGALMVTTMGRVVIVLVIALGISYTTWPTRAD